MEKKLSSITHIRSWVRTNGEMSEDGKSITYSCAELEAVIRESEAKHKEEIVKASAQGYILGADGFPLEVAYHYGQQWYKNQFEGGDNE